MTSNGSKLSRRSMFMGAGTAGAVAAAVSVLPLSPQPSPVAVEPKVAPEKGGGYTLSEHVKRYYKTTLV